MQNYLDLINIFMPSHMRSTYRYMDYFLGHINSKEYEYKMNSNYIYHYHFRKLLKEMENVVVYCQKQQNMTGGRE